MRDRKECRYGKKEKLMKRREKGGERGRERERWGERGRERGRGTVKQRTSEC